VLTPRTIVATWHRLRRYPRSRAGHSAAGPMERMADCGAACRSGHAGVGQRAAAGVPSGYEGCGISEKRCTELSRDLGAM